MKRKLVVFLLVLLAVGCVWYFSRDKAEIKHEPDLLFGRWWQDALPPEKGDDNPKKFYNGFVLFDDAGFGFFVKSSQYTLLAESAEFTAKDRTHLSVTFPQWERTENVTFSVWTCHKDGFDYCLEVRNLRGRPVRYYSNESWNDFKLSDFPNRMIRRQ
jgi:hypothetical protein